MRGRHSLTAHQKSCSHVPRRFPLFNLMAIKAKYPCLHSHCIHWRFIQFVALMLTAMSTAKRSKSGARLFQESWTADVGFVCRNDKAVCTLVQDDSEKNQGFFLVAKTE